MNDKLCKKCDNIKPLTEFSKNSRRKDGLQAYCKQCNKESNKQFRNKNPKYWSYETGYFSDKSKWAYIRENAKANKDIKIYKLDFPFGTYIGSTKRYIEYRMYIHCHTVFGLQKGIKSYTKKSLPFYHYLMDWSKEEVLEAFKNPTILEQCKGNVSKQYKLEKKWITEYMKKGTNLLNYHWVVPYK